VATRELRFPILLLAYLTGLALLLGSVLNAQYHAVSHWLSERTASVVHSLMGLIGNTRVEGVLVWYDGFPVEIVGECVGLYEVIIFSACVLAYPAPARAKWIGLPLGAAVIFVFNLVRIMGLLAVGRYQPQWFDFFHLYFWQSTLVLLVATVWLAWLKLIVRR